MLLDRVTALHHAMCAIQNWAEWSDVISISVLAWPSLLGIKRSLELGRMLKQALSTYTRLERTQAAHDLLRLVEKLYLRCH